MTTPIRPVRLRRRGRVHAVREDSYRLTLCNRNADGCRLADEAPNCKACVKAMLEELN